MKTLRTLWINYMSFNVPDIINYDSLHDSILLNLRQAKKFASACAITEVRGDLISFCKLARKEQGYETI